MKLQFSLVVSLWLVQDTVAESPSKAAFVKRTLHANHLTNVADVRRLVEDKTNQADDGGSSSISSLDALKEHPHFRNSRSNGNSRGLKSEFEAEESCDKSLLQCLPQDNCAECFRFLYGENIDWGTVTPDTNCEEVLGYLAKKDYCKDMHDDEDAKDAFCNSFDACAVWESNNDDDDQENDNDPNAPPKLDCSKLTECDWPGIHKSFIGDGNCQDDYEGCYNTAICEYDGGDCCEDTCHTTSDYVTCGDGGYMCRNPNSTNCDSSLTYDCVDGNKPEKKPDCSDDDAMYRLVMYDSFGDGWDQTAMTISLANKKKDVRFDGGLKEGSKGTEYLCLPKESTCMHVDVLGGEWGNEVSWEIRTMREGAPTIAGGSSPMSCDFSVGGEACENTCSGKPNIAPNSDPDYKEFKDMYTCIEDHCTIQVGVCEKDVTCALCLTEEKGDFCYGSEAFISVVDCTMCQCTERKGSEFCQSKLSPGIAPPVIPSGNGREPDGSPRPCSPQETMKGSDAVLTFGGCTNFDQVSLLVKNYDSNKFGLLDQFESCAHSFSASPDHGGHTALGCMQILVNAMNGADEGEEMDEAIAALADLLYNNAGDFCDCAAKASADCPLCSSFVHVKTLLFESLDACNSLDEIDCDAWAEFQKPCEKKIIDQFGAVDFTDSDICSYVHDGCGGSGAFPAFRRLDCEDEISKPSWDFYNDFARNCLKNGSDGKYRPRPTPSGNDTPASTPTDPPRTPSPTEARPATPRPTAKPYVPPGSSPTKPYYPPSEDDDSTNSNSYSSSSGSERKKHHVRNFFIVCLFAGVCYYLYKRRSNQFSFAPYRGSRNYAGGESEMYSAPYSGLAMSEGSVGAFEPPSLPPTPSAIDGGGY